MFTQNHDHLKSAGVKFAATRGNFLSAIALSTVLTAVAFAQHEHHSSGDQPAKLMPGLGDLHHPVSTRNPAAQKFFDQGLALIYAFNHEEARRSFEQAAKLDPKLAMARWGIALAVGPNYNEPHIDPSRLQAADHALEKANELAAGASERERDYIAALTKRFHIKTDLKKSAIDYRDAMAALHEKYPKDVDAAVLYADSMMNLIPWQVWTKDGRPAEGATEIVAVLESALKLSPNHIGANHLYIHAVEASKSPECALESANKLGKLAPGAGHLAHMPSHIYIRTGDYEAAAKVNEAAAEVDRAYIKSTGARGMYPGMYYSHNLHFQVESYNRMGRYAEAKRAATQLAGNARGHLKDMPALEGFLPSAFFVDLRFNRWDNILSLPQPEKETPITGALWHYARGVAFAGKGSVAEANKERELFANSSTSVSGDTPFGLNTAASIFKIAEHVLDARIAGAQGDRRAAVENWLKDLENNPRNGRSLFGLAESLKKQGKAQDAHRARTEFEKAWKNADVKLKIEDL